MKPERLVRFADSAVVIASFLFLAFAHPARANAVSVTCGTPKSGGGLVQFDTTVTIPFVGAQVSTSLDVNIPANSTAAAKCTLLADALAASYAANPVLAGDMAVSVTGTTLTISSPGGDLITFYGFVGDSTGEFTTLSAPVDPGVTVQLDEFFASADVVPPSGTFFFGSFAKAPVFGTFGVFADGTKDSATLLNDLNGSFTALTGISFNQPIFDGSQQIGWRTSPFDPPTVAFGWDGNTALDLANFGMEFRPPATTPEPGALCLAMLCLGIVAVLRVRSRPGRRDGAC